MYQAAAQFLLEQIEESYEIGLILGSGFGEIAERIKAHQTIPFGEIPNFPVSTVHRGNLIFGEFGGKNVVCMEGRVHFYEGYSMKELAVPVQTMRALGVKTLVILSAVGGICEAYTPGDVVMIADHIKWDLDSPLRGENPKELGERFFDMKEAYTPHLRTLAKEMAKELGAELKEGVYAYMGGPQFETPAEIRALRMMGADMVGMSTVPEVICAAHCAMETLAFGCITNMASGMDMGGFNKEVIAKAEEDGLLFAGKLIQKVVERIG